MHSIASSSLCSAARVRASLCRSASSASLRSVMSWGLTASALLGPPRQDSSRRKRFVIPSSSWMSSALVMPAKFRPLLLDPAIGLPAKIAGVLRPAVQHPPLGLNVL
jgi:hypothetical protein